MNSEYISTYQHENPNPTQSRTYTVNFFNTEITTVVTSDPLVVCLWVHNLRNKHIESLHNSSLVVGLGVQWRPSFAPYSPVAATLQLCAGTDCLIFQLWYTSIVTPSLRALLLDHRVTFVGIHNGRDERLLEESWAQLRVSNLIDMAKEEGFGKRSMEDICAQVLGFYGVVKPTEIGSGDWDELWLSDDQVQYACVDAHIAYLLGVAFGYPKPKYQVNYTVNNVNSSYYSAPSNDLWGGQAGGYSNDVCSNDIDRNSNKSNNPCYSPIAGYNNGGYPNPNNPCYGPAGGYSNTVCNNSGYLDANNPCYGPTGDYSNNVYDGNGYLNSNNTCYGPIGGFTNYEL